jgi:hypothetical protein
MRGALTAPCQQLAPDSSCHMQLRLLPIYRLQLPLLLCVATRNRA